MLPPLALISVTALSTASSTISTGGSPHLPFPPPPSPLAMFCGTAEEARRAGATGGRRSQARLSKPRLAAELRSMPGWTGGVMNPAEKCRAARITTTLMIPRSCPSQPSLPLLSSEIFPPGFPRLVEAGDERRGANTFPLARQKDERSGSGAARQAGQRTAN